MLPRIIKKFNDINKFHQKEKKLSWTIENSIIPLFNLFRAAIEQ